MFPTFAKNRKVTDDTVGLVFLSAVTASNSATVDIETTFDSTFDAYMLVGSGIVPVTDGVFISARLKVGGSYDAGANYKYHVMTVTSAASAYSGQNSTGDTKIAFILSDLGNAASEDGDFVMFIHNPDSATKQKRIYWTAANTTSLGDTATIVGSGLNTSTSKLTGVRFLAQTGNISAGTFRLYGITNT